MGHFAEIDENGVVLRVLVVDDAHDSDASGQAFLAETCGLGGVWKKTSYNTRLNEHTNGGTPLRGNFAGIGMVYDSELDAFYSPQLFPSWTLNHATFQWDPPVAMPADGKLYNWNEDSLSWIEMSAE
jgi:hypothetical protein